MYHAPRTTHRLLAAAAVAALVLGGCSCTQQQQQPDSGRPPECASRDDCQNGQICTQDGYCDDCSSSGQCRLKETCAPTGDPDAGGGPNRCQLRAGWGTDCARNTDCQAGQWCMQGLCKDRSEVSLCPSGSSSECPTGMRCNTINTVCEEDLGCAEDVDCSPGEKCNKGSHQCVPECTVDTQATLCAAGQSCVNGICVQCTKDADCGPGLICDAAGECATAQRCYSDRDCQVPLVCYLQTGACVSKTPPCVSDENCAPDQRCNVGTGKCVPRSCQPDTYEPNNDQAHAAGVTGGKTYTDLTLCLNDIDYFSIPLSRGDQLGVNLNADPFAENTFSTVIQDSTGRTLAAGHLVVNYVATAPQSYFIAVSSTDPFQPYDMSVLLSRGTPCDDDSYEPNDTPATATALNSAQTVEGAICPQDKDHFRINVPAGSTLRASLINYDASKGLLELCLFGSDGTTQLSCSTDVAPQVTTSAGDAGTQAVIIRVAGTQDRIANTYTLKVEFL